MPGMVMLDEQVSSTREAEEASKQKYQQSGDSRFNKNSMKLKRKKGALITVLVCLLGVLSLRS